MMEALQKNIAVTKGEALAAHLLASAALQAFFMMIPNKQEALSSISAFIDNTLNMSGPGKGDAHDEFNTQVREVARFQAMQTLDAIAQMIHNAENK